MTIREEMHSLVQDIIGSHETREADIGTLRQEVNTQKHETQDWLREVDKAHDAMAQQVRADLAKGRSDLAKDETQRKARVNEWMKEVDKTHNTMAQQQRADLTKGRSDLAHEETQRKAEIHDLMKRISTDHAEARVEWQDMAITLQAKRSASVKAPKARADGKGIAEQLASLSNSVIDYLTNHPGGSRLAEIEGEFRLKRFEAAGIVKHLRDGGKVEKRDLLYFAV
ncbi:MAG: hypothetical protein HY666_03785 [Chloroflexi bacterium]|nr:hypothetical protein [Chloroflexota bacterium]